MAFGFSKFAFSSDWFLFFYDIYGFSFLMADNLRMDKSNLRMSSGNVIRPSGPEMVRILMERWPEGPESEVMLTERKEHTDGREVGSGVVSG